MYEDVYGHCPTCGRIHWRDKGCDSESKPFYPWDKEAEEEAKIRIEDLKEKDKE